MHTSVPLFCSRETGNYRLHKIMNQFALDMTMNTANEPLSDRTWVGPESRASIRTDHRGPAVLAAVGYSVHGGFLLPQLLLFVHRDHEDY